MTDKEIDAHQSNRFRELLLEEVRQAFEDFDITYHYEKAGERLSDCLGAVRLKLRAEHIGQKLSNGQRDLP